MYSGTLAASTTPPTTATFNFVFHWYLASGIIAGGFVIGMLVFFAVKYRARPGVPPSDKPGPHSIWIVVAIVTIMAVALGAAGYQTFAAASNIEIPNDPGGVTVKLLAYQWGWNFTYPNGKFTIDDMVVPANTVIIVNITSKDVDHSFGIPFLAVKEDAIPGQLNQLWFEVPTQGTYIDAIHCFELCGVGHATMIGNLTVVSQQTWEGMMNGTIAMNG